MATSISPSDFLFIFSVLLIVVFKISSSDGFLVRNSVTLRTPTRRNSDENPIARKPFSLGLLSVKKEQTAIFSQQHEPKETELATEILQQQDIFENFAAYLQVRQEQIIKEIEHVDNSGEKFTRDGWGIFSNTHGKDYSNSDNSTVFDSRSDDKEHLRNGNKKDRESGGMTRVMQNGNIIEKGACSFTLLKGGILTADRADSIRARHIKNITDGNEECGAMMDIKEGDTYSAAALSMVLHTRSPMVPTFRSDVRIFMVEPQKENCDSMRDKGLVWFGGGADLTPYYLFDDDITFFHKNMKNLCDSYNNSVDYKKSDNSMDESKKVIIDYQSMKKECDRYFYLPARSEHRGTGGIFFDDMLATAETLVFVKSVVNSWMPSWLPIVKKRQSLNFSEEQRQWQLLRRGRYLEFNLLYDRGVKFGLANENPRVEGVMVSAPPLIAWEYNHKITENSEESRLMKILKNPIDWVS